MKTDKLQTNTEDVKKSYLGSIHQFLRKYADNCRYSFDGMLRI